MARPRKVPNSSTSRRKTATASARIKAGEKYDSRLSDLWLLSAKYGERIRDLQARVKELEKRLPSPAPGEGLNPVPPDVLKAYGHAWTAGINKEFPAKPPEKPQTPSGQSATLKVDPLALLSEDELGVLCWALDYTRKDWPYMWEPQRDLVKSLHSRIADLLKRQELP